MKKHIIYADHAATTPLTRYAQLAMRPYLEDDFFNPSTLYSAAKNSRKAIEIARAQIAECIGALPEEIFFTCGGTEADNWAIKGTAFRYPNQRKRIITSQIEHHAVLNSCAFLERLGYEVVYLPVDSQGVVSTTDLLSAVNLDTVLVSIMYANNEIGTIEPIEELAMIAHRSGIPFHSDAVQAIGNIPVNVNDISVDMLSASAHKFGGPKGVGFLYVRKGLPLESLLSGGGQERNQRAGTENVAGIVGMAAALSEKLRRFEEDEKYLLQLRKKLLIELAQSGLNYRINGAVDVLPGTISISFKGISGEALLHRLDLMGIQVATGSACDSKETQVSHVLRALHLEDEYANGTIRISLGTDNDETDPAEIVRALMRICKK